MFVLLLTSLRLVSTKITFLFALAKATAILLTKKLFPSFCLGLVNKITFLLLIFDEYNIFVLVVFKHSTVYDFGSVSIINY